MRKMKMILSLALILAMILPGVAQKVPKEFRERFEELKKRNAEAKKMGADVVLDFWPEQIPQVSTTAADDGGTWAYKATGLEENYQTLKNGCTKPMVIFLFDTGGKYTHPGLKDVAWNELGKVFTGESEPEDGNGHSTHCAGTYGGTHPLGWNIGLARVLVEKKLLRIVPVKVLSNGGSGSFTGILDGINYANGLLPQLVSQGYGVVYSFSLGGGTQIYQPVADALKKAAGLGAMIVAAAGNTGSAGVQYPGADPSAFAIGALELVSGEMRWVYFSTFGDKVFGSAPGHQIYSTYPPDTYANLSGTSMATPAFGALLAVTSSYFATASPSQIVEYFKKNVFDLPPTGFDQKTGWGVPIMTRLLAGNPGGGDPPPPSPTCAAPTLNQVVVGNITAGTAVGACTAQGSLYLWRYRIIGSQDWINAETARGSVAMMNLSPGTNYELQAAVKCMNGTTSGYSVSRAFSTLGASPPILPVKPKFWTAEVAIPPGDAYNVYWKTKDQEMTQSLTIRALKFDVYTNLYDEDIAELIEAATAKFFKNSSLVVRNTDGYIVATSWVSHFLKLFIETELVAHKVKVTVTKITGENQKGYYCEILNPVTPKAEWFESAVLFGGEEPPEVRWYLGN